MIFLGAGSAFNAEVTGSGRLRVRKKTGMPAIERKQIKITSRSIGCPLMLY
jgi:hypothetical protein